METEIFHTVCILCRQKLLDFQLSTFQMSAPRSRKTRNSAFCDDHCKVAETNKIPIDLREFLHTYCGAPKENDNDEGKHNLKRMQIFHTFHYFS